MPQLAELRRAIEDLALQIVVGSPAGETSPAEWLPAFERVREDALRNGAGQVAAAAASVVDSLRGMSDGPEGAGSLSNELTNSMLRLQEAVDREDGIVRELLEFSASPQFDLKPEDINEVIEQSLRLIKYEIRAANVTVECKLASPLAQAL